jgi:hypothetical protein
MEEAVKYYQGNHDKIIALMNQASTDLDAFDAETGLMTTQLEMAAEGQGLAEFLDASGVNEQRDRILRNFATSEISSRSQESVAALQVALSADNVTGKY